MTQTKLGSLYEALFNVAIGFGINYCANLLILPLIGCRVTLAQNLFIGTLFTVISIVRSYAIRRWFNAKLHELSVRLSA